jgi:large subunit ribosomal protein L10
MPRADKVSEVERLQARLRGATAVILADFRGLTVAELTQLRARLREAGVDFRVVKNRLFQIAGRAVGLGALGDLLEGPTAVAFTPGDPVAAAKLLQEFSRQSRKLTIKGSIVSGVVYDEARTRALAELPSRQELLARAVGGIAAPLTGLAGVLSALPRHLVSALDQIRRQRAAA